MNEQESIKATREAAIFIAAHCALAVLCMWIAPEAQEEIPRPLAWWGQVLGTILPNIEGLSGITRFVAAAWLTLVLMWTLMPLSAWWVARGDWVIRPDVTLLRRHPWLLMLLAFLLLACVVLLTLQAPGEVGGWASFHKKVLSSAISSPTAFGIFVGLMNSGIAICLGVLPKLVRVAREVTSDDAL